MIRKGCIYIEEQRNVKGRVSRGCGVQGRRVRGVGWVAQTRRRWVGEIVYHRKRYRSRSTNFENVRTWLRMMSDKFSD